VLLAYHIGRQRSYLLLLGGPMTQAKAFPLTIPAEVVKGLADAAAKQVADATPSAGKAPPGEERRGLRVQERNPRPEPALRPPAVGAGGSRPLNQNLTRALVAWYRNQIAHPTNWDVRSLEVRPREPDRPGPSLRLDAVGNVLLPEAVRQSIRKLEPKYLVVIPDGALHKLPLEALVLQNAPQKRYALDVLPPIVYAPSAAVLALLAERPRPAGADPLSLLTVCDPAYTPEKDEAVVARANARRGGLVWRGQLQRLEGTREESQRIRRHFDPGQFTALEGAEATERAVRAAVAGKRILHLAAHGLVDERSGNLFGALALTPPLAGKESEDDGFLELHEIYRLPLQDCELAVLSACDTNVGPQRPLEAGVTLASGFLAAGARGVVASHWSVADLSTATLMARFFEEVMATDRRKNPVSYARALRNAQLKVRNTKEWSAPFHWAPFVLIGPAE
jgi:CHAT domain-containing protein